MHTAEDSPGLLPAVLNRSSLLPVVNGSHQMPIYPGRVYVAPPSMHMKVHRGQVILNAGPRENRHRPSIDVLFRSAANAYGERVIGVVLSGYLNDGSMGLEFTKKHGGLAIVQDPDEAIAASMPLQALEKSEVDFVLPVCDIGAKLVSLVGAGEPQTGGPVMEKKPPVSSREGHAGMFSCPDCGGVLQETREGNLTRFLCRVGHG
jgi:two-component system chemotaxis response regulator CheB